MTISDFRIFVSKGILSKSSEDAASAERVGKEEGKRAGDILHDRLTSRREEGAREGRVDRSRRAKWSGEFASEEGKMGASDRLDLLKHELADRPTGKRALGSLGDAGRQLLDNPGPS